MPSTGDIYSLSESKTLIDDLIQKLKLKSTDQDSYDTQHLVPMDQLESALEQFFEVYGVFETEPELVNLNGNDLGSISEIGEYGLQLLSDLEQWLNKANLEGQNQIQHATLSLASWIHDHKGVLQQLENIVNALTQVANHTNKSEDLIKLHKIAEKIINSSHESIKADTDKSEMGRPWRILNLNHGIIATRTHNTEIMNRVFEQLLLRLPNDAAQFFADGMKQMDIVGYPEHVKHVMEQYYMLTNQPTLH